MFSSKLPQLRYDSMSACNELPSQREIGSPTLAPQFSTSTFKDSRESSIGVYWSQGNDGANRLAGKTTIASGSHLTRPQVLRSLRRYGHKAKEVAPSVAWGKRDSERVSARRPSHIEKARRGVFAIKHWK